MKGVLDADPKIISGAVQFVGTRVLVQALIDTLDGGSPDEFLDGWPDVTRQQPLTRAVYYRWLRLSQLPLLVVALIQLPAARKGGRCGATLPRHRFESMWIPA